MLNDALTSLLWSHSKGLVQSGVYAEHCCVWVINHVARPIHTGLIRLNGTVFTGIYQMAFMCLANIHQCVPFNWIRLLPVRRLYCMIELFSCFLFFTGWIMLCFRHFHSKDELRKMITVKCLNKAGQFLCLSRNSIKGGMTGPAYFSLFPFVSSLPRFNRHAIWRIHSWKLLSTTKFFHFGPLSSNGGLSALFKGTLGTEESFSVSCLDSHWDSIWHPLSPASLSNL